MKFHTTVVICSTLPEDMAKCSPIAYALFYLKSSYPITGKEYPTKRVYENYVKVRKLGIKVGIV